VVSFAGEAAALTEGVERRCRIGDGLEAALLSQARSDRCDASLALAECIGAGVNGVVAKDEVVIVRNGRADDELRVGSGRELDGTVRGLEGGEIALAEVVGHRNGAFPHGGPEDGVCGRRLVAPALALLQSHREIV
jgi:hypothetical protein